MPKKSDTPEPAKAEAESLIQPRKIIQVSSSDEETSVEPVASSSAPVSKKPRIEPLAETLPVEKSEDVQPVEPEESAPKSKPATAAADKPAEGEAEELKLDTSAPEPLQDNAPDKAASPQPPKLEKPVEPSAEEKPAETPAAPEPESGFDLGDDSGDEGQHPLDEAQAKVDKEALEKQQALDKLVESETYFLPINAVEKRRAKFFWAALLVIVVAAAAAAVWANGAGYLSIPGLPE
jgi:hypothetical protein